MLGQDDFLAIIFDCISEVNKQLPPNERIVTAEDSIFVGEGGTLDSLSIITLLASVEDAVAARTGTRILLIDDPNVTEEMGRFHTLGSLADFIAQGCS